MLASLLYQHVEEHNILPRGLHLYFGMLRRSWRDLLRKFSSVTIVAPAMTSLQEQRVPQKDDLAFKETIRSAFFKMMVEVIIVDSRMAGCRPRQSRSLSRHKMALSTHVSSGTRC